MDSDHQLLPLDDASAVDRIHLAIAAQNVIHRPCRIVGCPVALRIVYVEDILDS